MTSQDYASDTRRTRFPFVPSTSNLVDDAAVAAASAGALFPIGALIDADITLGVMSLGYYGRDTSVAGVFLTSVTEIGANWVLTLSDQDGNPLIAVTVPVDLAYEAGSEFADIHGENEANGSVITLRVSRDLEDYLAALPGDTELDPAPEFCPSRIYFDCPRVLSFGAVNISADRSDPDLVYPIEAQPVPGRTVPGPVSGNVTITGLQHSSGLRAETWETKDELSKPHPYGPRYDGYIGVDCVLSPSGHECVGTTWAPERGVRYLVLDSGEKILADADGRVRIVTDNCLRVSNTPAINTVSVQNLCAPCCGCDKYRTVAEYLAASAATLNDNRELLLAANTLHSGNVQLLRDEVLPALNRVRVSASVQRKTGCNAAPEHQFLLWLTISLENRNPEYPASSLAIALPSSLSSANGYLRQEYRAANGGRLTSEGAGSWVADSALVLQGAMKPMSSVTLSVAFRMNPAVYSAWDPAAEFTLSYTMPGIGSVSLPFKPEVQT